MLTPHDVPAPRTPIAQTFSTLSNARDLTLAVCMLAEQLCGDLPPSPESQKAEQRETPADAVFDKLLMASVDTQGMIERAFTAINRIRDHL